MGDEALPDDTAPAGQNLQHPLGEPRLQGQRTDAQRTERSELGRLEDHRIAGGERRCEPPPGDGHGEIPRDDDPHHAQGLVKREIDTSGDRYLETAVPLGCGGVVLEHVAHIARLPTGIPDDVAGIRHLEHGQFLPVGVHRCGKTAQQACPVSRCNVVATPRRRSPHDRWPRRPRAR